ncbi:Tripeptidyl-peptidase sed1 [Lachnellula cervina]|uniref:Tripeptidyl-peptidase sed1 n=1 Tax=Lachnellula cervina TaxID=1316786 RepID=A0A7D8URD0_9HELO|nr:Tripeptidyl-peptidase sed1 [Lachnellula cervina]
MKLGMQGVSIILASGDSGAVARRLRWLSRHRKCLQPGFPSHLSIRNSSRSSLPPHRRKRIQGPRNCRDAIPIWRLLPFSNIYAQPTYQNATLATYFAEHDPGYKSYATSGTNNPSAATTNGCVYNRAGRGYPDVSAVGDNVVVYLNGVPTLISGVGVFAPVFGAVSNRINEERLAVGKRTVGFVNPALYAKPGVFNDIIHGSNLGCKTNGFSAVKGWGLVTGLGTPNNPALLELFMSLP